MEGELAHRDSMTNGSVITPGEVPVMSAGTGINHSEYNYSEEHETKLLEIWLFSDKQNVKPRYDHAKFAEAELAQKWRIVVSHDGAQNSLWIHQLAWFSMGDFKKDSTTAIKLHHPENGIYLFVISGTIQIAEETLLARDGIGIEGLNGNLSIEIKEDAKLLAIEVPIK